MFEREILVPTAGGEMTVFAAHPDGDGPYPVAVLYMDAIGYRDQIKENAKRFAAGGFYCVAPDLFYRTGDRLAFEIKDLMDPESETGKLFAKAREQATPENVVADTEAILETIATDPAASAGPKVCVGYCMGARIALRVASALPGEFVATAGIHPGALVTDDPDSPHHDIAGVRGELYFAFAENDRSATPENVDRFREELERHGVKGVVERLPGTSHGFAMADLPVYDSDAAERHFERTLGLWRRNLSSGPAAV